MSLRRLLAGCLASLLLSGCTRTRALVVGMDATYPPFEFIGTDGKINGVSVAIGEAIGKVAGRPIEFRHISFEGLIPALQSGQIDLIISSLTANEERRGSIDFSEPYVKNGLAILASKDGPVHSAEDLNAEGRRVAVRLATTGEQWCRQSLPKATIVSLDNDTACVLEVRNGTVDAWVYDQVSIMNYNQQNPDRTRALLAPLREEVWAVGLKKGREELKAQVNQAIAEMKQSGAFARLADQFLAKERALMKAQGLPFVFE
ncbi:MAG TPA: transporter substrate-binding domain-containing protein [Prosthecobacter sp.]|nr:transporter substrate-binding domain-containing protein [Prosthecobacter sp.]